MRWEDIPNIQWYGERGIVNAVVTYINQNPKDRIDRLKKFLGAIEWWGNKAKNDWISKINEKTEFKIVVELGLSDFGSPDLIIVCIVNDEKYCIFIEAKVGQYKKSMQSNAEGMSKGFNSSINGQLSLKYRFTTALKTLRCEDNSLSEPLDIYERYKERFPDDLGRQRKIGKVEIINNILEPLGLSKIDDDRFYFVAWTWDDDEHIFFKDDEVTTYDNGGDIPVGMPLFFDEKGIHRKLKEQLGWLGYKNLEKFLSLDKFPEYMKARKIMIPYSAPGQEDVIYNAKNITSVNLREFKNNKKILNLLEEIKEIFEAYKAFESVPEAGSYSIKYNRIVVAKIIPQHDYVFVGFRINHDYVPLEKPSKDYSVKKARCGYYYKGFNIAKNRFVEKNEKKFINECLDHIITRDKEQELPF